MINTTEVIIHRGNRVHKIKKICCFDTNLKKKKWFEWDFNSKVLFSVFFLSPCVSIDAVSSLSAATWWSQCNLAKLCLSMALDCSDLVGGTQNSRQLFALIVRCVSALLTVADAFLINGKRCIYILVSGTRQLLR